MADVFGDMDLFSEFEKEREAQASFIHYEEDTVRSRIIFEDVADDQESESEDEFTTEKIEEKPTALIETGKNGTNAIEAQMESSENKDEDLESHVTEDEGSKSGGNAEDSKAEKDTSAATSTNGSSVSVSGGKIDGEHSSTEDEERAIWLNEQLFAEAADEAKKTNYSAQQLIYERNKFRRYAKILDSTRYVPDDDSPAVQLIFNNNSFARKYRQQIEQFIKGLLWEEFNSSSQDSVPEISVKPGFPSCIDINSDLPPEKRAERMRQKHAIIGNSQFHKQFLIDFLGWPFMVPEPTRCNVNWEIPIYGQVFNEVYADPTNKIKKASMKKPKATCWNCGEENHAVFECKQPRNQAKITANRKEFLIQQQQNQSSFEPKFTGPSRYHLDRELSSEFSKFKPGVLSEALRQALGLAHDQLPQHIYKMRLFGYPPGWLAEARMVQSGVTIFDKNGRVTLITGECLEDGELEEEEEGTESKTEYDVSKIIEYPGFTVPVPLGFIDEHSNYKMPPIQHHQLKKTLASTKKRKREKDQDEAKETKKFRSTDSEQEDGEVKEEGELGTEDRLEETKEGSTETEAAETSPGKIEEVNTTPSIVRSSSTISLSRDFGTPVLVREKLGLPDASKFGQGIEEHIPYENLPNSTGTFEKMKGLLDLIRQKSKKQT